MSLGQLAGWASAVDLSSPDARQATQLLGFKLDLYQLAPAVLASRQTWSAHLTLT